MPADIAEIVALLQREYAFQELTPEQIAWVAARFQVITLERETVVFSQGAPPDFLYIVYKGRVRVVRGNRGRERLLNVLSPGDFFGEEALLFDRPRSASVVTVETTTLLRMERQPFFEVLEAFPSVREALVATAQSRRLARGLQFGWLGAEEVIYFLTRKHEFFLMISLILPIFAFVASIPVIVIGLAQLGTPFIYTMARLAGFLMLVGSIAWGAWNYIDWGNDYYIVTNQRVIWLEKVIGLYDSRREAPLDTILAVNIRSSQIGRLAGYGDVSVRTFTGGILMRNAGQPQLFASFVEGFKRRMIQISKEEEARAMAQDLEQALRRRMLANEEPQFYPPQSGPPPVTPIAPAPPPKKQKRKPVSFRQWWENLLKVRYEEGGVITYRKHWFILLTKTWMPLLGLAFLITGDGYLYYLALVGRALLPLAGLTAISFLIWLGLFLWLAYQYMDWSNDIYRLTADQILDIEKKPLGTEQKKTAPLESILSIEHERANIIGILLNFGIVTVNVGDTRFIFFGVYNPDQVHQDIADHREALNRRKREQEAKRERERMINWLVTYDLEAHKLDQELENEPGGDEF